MPRWTETLEERLERRHIKTPGGCWRWIGTVDRDGYGRIQHAGGYRMAHRVMLLALGVDLPADMHVDHLCHNRRCVNPAHLDVVTSSENSRRMHRDQLGKVPRVLAKHCKWGHELAGANLRVNPDGARVCRACVRRRSAECKQRKLAAQAIETPAHPDTQHGQEVGE